MREGKQRIVDALTGSEEITALVGGRIYHRNPPVKPTFPLITYSEIATGGDSADGKVYFRRPRMEVRGWGGDVEALEEAIITALETLPAASYIESVQVWDPDQQIETVAVEYRLLLKV